LTKANLPHVKELTRAEILFYDPLNVDVRFQTRLDRLAVEELLRGDR